MTKLLEIWCGAGGFHVQATEDQEKDIVAFVEKCSQHGVTRLFPAMNRSDTFPRFINFDGEAYPEPVYTLKDFYAKWHPLKALIKAAHDRDMEVHPYLNINNHGGQRPFSESALNGNEFGAPVKTWMVTMDTTRFASENLEFWKLDRSGKNSFQLARNIRLSPAFEEVRAYEQSLLLEVVEEFGADGVQLEFALEPIDEDGVNVYGYEEPAVEAFKQEHGVNPLDIPNSDPDWIDFRCNYVTTFVRDLRARLGEISRPVALTTAIIANEPQNYLKTLQDWPRWVKEDLLDGVYLWFREFVDLDTIVPQTKHAAGVIDGRCPLIAELSCYHRGSLNTPQLLKDGARLAREGGADAVGVYRSDPIEALGLWETVSEIGEGN